MDNNLVSDPEPDDWLQVVLRETELDQFYSVLKDNLQLSRYEHFDPQYLKDSDLEGVGLSQPAIRRLRNAVKKHKVRTKRARIVSKIIGRPDQPGTSRAADENASSFTCLITRENVKIYEQLGAGSFAVVKRGVWTQPTGKKIHVAVKQLSSSPGGGKSSDDISNDVIYEVNSMHALSHENLVKLFGVVLSKPMMMVFELCDGGALLDRLRCTDRPVPLITRLYDWSIQIVRGMAYLEYKRFIHRDLACRNVLLTKDETIVKICDFGLMRSLPDHGDHYVMNELKKVPFAWCAPESLKKRIFSTQSDIWSFGVTLWEIFSYGDDPWTGCGGPEVLERVMSGQRLSRPITCPPSIYDLMTHCWSSEPKARPTFAALKRHMKEFHFAVAECKIPQDSTTLLDMRIGDRIILTEGLGGSTYWSGQNMRTHKFGKFPRKAIALKSKDKAMDISHPVKGSFVHTGHGDPGEGESWGDPSKIDPIYLKHPMPLLELSEDKSGEHHSISSTSSHDGWLTFDDENGSSGTGSMERGGPLRNSSGTAESWSSAEEGVGGPVALKPPPPVAKPQTSPTRLNQPLTDGRWAQIPSPPRWAPQLNRTVSSGGAYYAMPPAAVESPATPVIPAEPLATRSDLTNGVLYDVPAPEPPTVPQVGSEDPFEIDVNIMKLTSSMRYSQLVETSNGGGRGGSSERPASLSHDVGVPYSYVRKQSEPVNLRFNNSTGQLPNTTTLPPSAREVAAYSSDVQFRQNPWQNQQQRYSVDHSDIPPNGQRPFTYMDKATLAGAMANMRRSPGQPPQPTTTSMSFSLSGAQNQMKRSVTPNFTLDASPRFPPASGSTVIFGHQQQNYSSSCAPSYNGGSKVTSLPDVSVIPSQEKARMALEDFDPLVKTIGAPTPSDINKVRREVPFATMDKCERTLRRVKDGEKAIQELKLEKLFDLGLSESKIACKKALEETNYDMDAAASRLLGM